MRDSHGAVFWRTQRCREEERLRTWSSTSVTVRV